MNIMAFDQQVVDTVFMKEGCEIGSKGFSRVLRQSTFLETSQEVGKNRQKTHNKKFTVPNFLTVDI